VDAVQEADARVLWRPALAPGTQLAGPAVLQQYDTTTLVPPRWTARVDQRFNLIMEREAT
jgi:N-methylhydantoinase A